MDSFSYRIMPNRDRMLIIARNNGGMTMRPRGECYEKAKRMADEGLCIVEDRRTPNGIEYAMLRLTGEGRRRAEKLAA